MSDTNDKSKPKRRPLTLNKSGSGTVRQSFSGGRSKSVVVEKKKRRIIGGPGKPATKPSAESKSEPKVDEVAEAARKLGLSKAEYVKRQKAVKSAVAKADEKEEKRKAEEAARKARMAEEKAALEAKKKEEEAPAAPPAQEVLLAEIRDLLAKQAK